MEPMYTVPFITSVSVALQEVSFTRHFFGEHVVEHGSVKLDTARCDGVFAFGECAQRCALGGPGLDTLSEAVGLDTLSETVNNPKCLNLIRMFSSHWTR